MAKPARVKSSRNSAPQRCWMCGQVCAPGDAWQQTLISFLGNPAPWRCIDINTCMERYQQLDVLARQWPEPFRQSRSLQDCLRFLVASGATPEAYGAAREAYLHDVEATR